MPDRDELLFGGWGFMGGFIPLIPPSVDAGQVASAYGADVNIHRIGTLLGLIGIFLAIPFFFVISMQIRRTERRIPSLAILQFASGIIVTVVLIIPMLLLPASMIIFFKTGPFAWRPESVDSGFPQRFSVSGTSS